MDPQNPNQPDNLQQQVPPPQISSTNRLRTPIIVLLAVFLLSGVGLGAYFLGKNQTNQPQIAQSSPTPTPNPTANWITYKNGQLGYSISYPASFSTRLNDLGTEKIKSFAITDMNLNADGSPTRDNVLYESPSPIGGGFTIYKGFLLEVQTTGLNSPDDVIANLRNSSKTDQQINVDGATGYQHSAIREGNVYEGKSISTQLIKDKKIYSIYASFPANNNAYDELFNRMFSTLKFTE